MTAALRAMPSPALDETVAARRGPSAGVGTTATTMTAVAAIVWACRRDLLLALRSRSELALIVVFFVLVISLFPLGVSPDPPAPDDQ